MRATRFAGFVLASLLAGLVLTITAPGPPALFGVVARLTADPQSTIDNIGGEQAVVTLAAVAGWVLLGWIAVAGLLTAAAAAPGLIGRSARRLSRYAVPAAARTVLCAVLGVGVLNAAIPAHASEVPAGALARHSAPTAATAGPAPQSTTAPPADPAGLDLDWPISPASGRPRMPHPGRSAGETSDAPRLTSPGPTPSRVPGTPDPQVPNAPRPPDKAGEPVPAGDPERHAVRNPPVIVRPGDSLWSIAAHELGPGAADSRIAQEWPRWWAANREAIGDDPDLINPGQRLIPPPATLTKEPRS